MFKSKKKKKDLDIIREKLRVYREGVRKKDRQQKQQQQEFPTLEIKPQKTGLKMRLDPTLVRDMRDFAISIVDSEGNFYRTIANKFNVGIATSYRYCSDIHKKKFQKKNSQ